jgi:pyruvate,water dikinase
MNKPNHPTIVWLGEPPANDPALVGEKAAILSRLTPFCRVPFGFCLTTEAFRQAAHNSGAAFSLPDILSTAYHLLAQRCALGEPVVTVRLSAVEPERLDLSLAGQSQAAFHLQGSKQIGAFVQRCWEMARNLLPDSSVAILVQQLVQTETSAIVLSANPLTGNYDEVVIYANWGLGASIVDGAVTSDIYIVSKANPAVFSVQVADKERISVAGPEGAYEVAVPDILRRRLALVERQIAGLAQLAVKVEVELGYPVEIECAYQSETLYLLCCRPLVLLSGQ